ncbi:MAG TPA: 50S ribosomal protein L4 [Candidatus Woesearchaeota archaeon]|nr:50S ribosomal protein L4 [Candidatus Woesearchaeota archaeon]
MKIPIFNKDCQKDGEVELPKQFNEDRKASLIKKAIRVYLANQRQKYGAFKFAGMRQSAELSRRRRDYKTSYGHGISRVQRKILSKRGSRMYWVGAVSPGTVGGRKAHPAKSDKIWSEKINITERRAAIRSALSSSMNAVLVKERGHIIPQAYPFAISKEFEEISKTKEFIDKLNKLGFENELKRTSVAVKNKGRAKLRNRKKRAKKGLLVIVSAGCKLTRAARNIPGIDIVSVNNLNVYDLAPGYKDGRAILITLPSINIIKEKNLFM